MLKVLLFCLTAAIFLACPVAIKACVCIDLGPEMSFDEARVVFIGKAISGTESTSVDDRGNAYDVISGSVTFQVDEIFKGKADKMQLLEVPSNKGNSCGPYGLERGETYVVYAYVIKGYEKLFTGACTRTAAIRSAKEDVEFLRSLPPRSSGGNIVGSILLTHREIFNRLPGSTSGIDVEITGPDNKTLTVQTDSKGTFSVPNLREGEYTINAKLPSDRFNPAEKEVVFVSDRGKTNVVIWARFKSTIFVKVVDKSGTAFNQTHLTLEGNGVSVYGESEWKNGNYTIGDVAPGKYKLFIEMISPTGERPKYYYPGTYDPEKAGNIEIKERRSLSGLKFVLPDDFRVVKVSGIVQWPDGRAASEIWVKLDCAKRIDPAGKFISLYLTAKTDRKGVFSIDAIADTTYELAAESDGGSDGSYSKAQKISVVSDQVNKKLILSEKGWSEGCARQ